MTAARLRAVFTAAVAAGLACNSTPRPPTSGTPTPGDGKGLPPGTPAFSAPVCTHEQLLLGLDTAHTNARFEHVILRETTLRPTDTGPKPQQSQSLATAGLACQTADNKQACAYKLASAVTTTSLFPAPDPNLARYLVLQHDANVKTVATRAQLLTLLGAIDTPGEARLLAATLGIQPLCAEDSVRAIDGGFQVIGKRPQSTCINQFEGVLIDVVRGQTSVSSTVDLTDPTQGCMASGRRPEGFAGPRRQPGDPLVAWLGQMQELEAASVPAFERLARELEGHGAPESLVARARAAADDEVRHAAAFAGLRARHGAPPCEPAALPDLDAVRLLERLAVENAVEGCVRETYGALVARYQAEVADDPALRRLFAAIAEDETRHAELAWDVHTWLEGQLDAAARARVATARASSVRELRAAVVADATDPELARRSGLPTGPVAELLFDRCAAALWAA
ncbi:ferritin-like domain-containing protein [Nannocystis radixulma]|uniref:Ferritin-like domain-containing protein n=1 Tax=Nannocystis radixulma TaxID=2995305 RepID=A0ABT5BM56_9BACT|nr:ferritin-like domain-containing protein [Nannocystis radixulma]MDC0675249.1 ferritin-like domain-containing protein [Nannocystis radixulma]